MTQGPPSLESPSANPLPLPPAPTIPGGCSPCPSPFLGCLHRRVCFTALAPWALPGTPSPPAPLLPRSKELLFGAPRQAEAQSIFNWLPYPALAGRAGWGLGPGTTRASGSGGLRAGRGRDLPWGLWDSGTSVLPLLPPLPPPPDRGHNPAWCLWHSQPHGVPLSLWIGCQGSSCPHQDWPLLQPPGGRFGFPRQHP